MNSNVYHHHHSNSDSMQRDFNSNRHNHNRILADDDNSETDVHKFTPPRFKNPSLSPPKIRRTSSLPSPSHKKQTLQRALSDISPIKKPTKPCNKRDIIRTHSSLFQQNTNHLHMKMHENINKENEDMNLRQNEINFQVPNKHKTLSNSNQNYRHPPNTNIQRINNKQHDSNRYLNTNRNANTHHNNQNNNYKKKVTFAPSNAPQPHQEPQQNINQASVQNMKPDPPQNIKADPPQTQPKSNHNMNKNDMSKLAYWGLPEALIEGYTKEGITTLYEWQVECMNNAQVLRGGNLVYSAPTGGGKTLVAEMLMLRNILRTKRKALFVLPFVSIVVEKVRYFTKIFKKAKIKVKGFYSNKGSAGGLGRNCNIAICTIEKANSIVNKLITANTLMDTIGIVVLDEMHMIGDGHRGYILELLLTKIRYVQEQISDQYQKSIEKQVHMLQHNDGEMLVSQTGDDTQINAFPSMNPENDDATNRIQVVGLSATLPNLDIICDWLSATKYITNYRPIPLKEFMKIDNQIIDKHGIVVRRIGMRGGVKRHEDRDQISILCAEVVQKKLSCIVFCHSKKACQTLATKLSKLLPRMICMYKEDKQRLETQRTSILFKLKKCSFGVDTVLSETVKAGIAYHHSGLTLEERAIVEDAFTKGIISVITATSTLAAGVNLPARRVIFRNMKMGWNKIDIANYKQMSGRAGRAGKDTAGESILCIKKHERKDAMTLMNAPLPPLKSCLSLDMVGLTRVLNEAIASKIVKTVNDIERFIKCTLLKAQTQEYDAVHRAAHKAVKFLAHNNFIIWQKSIKTWLPTKLGEATFSSSMDPEHALTLYRDLSLANKKVIIADDLHIVYQITPLPCYITPPWDQFVDYVDRMDATRRKVIHLLGLNMAFFHTLCHSGNPSISKVKERVRKYNDKSLEQEKNDPNKPKTRAPKRDVNGLTFDHKVVIAQRLWAALIICDIVKEIPSMAIAQRFAIDHGLVQSLQASVSTFAGMVHIFCEKLHWTELQILVSEYQERVQFGFISKSEETKLKPFFKLGHNIMTKTIARVLYDNDIKNIEQLASQSAEFLQSILSESTPFQLKQRVNQRRDGIDPRLGMKLVYVAKQFMNKKNELQQKRLQKRDNAMTQVKVETQDANSIKVTPSGTQYNMNHGYKVNKKCESKMINPIDKLFHTNLHTQKPYTQLAVKQIPSKLLNTHNDSLLIRKKFTPQKRSFCDITPSQIFTPKAKVNTPLHQIQKHVTESLPSNIIAKEASTANDKRMEIDAIEDVHDPEEKEECLTDIQPTTTGMNTVAVDEITEQRPMTPIRKKQCTTIPAIHSKEIVRHDILKQVFADFFSPSHNGSACDLNLTRNYDAVRQLSFKSTRKSSNEFDELSPLQPALKKRKLNSSQAQITALSEAQQNKDHPHHKSIHKRDLIPRMRRLVPDLSDDEDDLTVLVNDETVHKLSQQMQDNINVDTPKQILVHETQFNGITPVHHHPSYDSTKKRFFILFPETPSTPFGDCTSFEKNVNHLIQQNATMCNLYVPGIIEIHEENKNDDFIVQQTQSNKKLKKTRGPLTNRLFTPRSKSITTQHKSVSVQKKKKRSDKEEMSDDEDEIMSNSHMNHSIISKQNVSKHEIRQEVRKQGGFGKVYLEQKSMNLALNVRDLKIYDEEIERKLWNKCIPQSIKHLDVGRDKKIPFVPLVINVFVNEETYSDFIAKWRKQRAFAWSLWGKYDQLPVMNSKLESLFVPSYRRKIKQLTRSDIGGFSISWSSKRSYIIELNHILRHVPDFVCKPMVWSDIVSIFENPRTIKIAYNSKMQLQILRTLGIHTAGKIWDPRIAHWLIEPDQVSSSNSKSNPQPLSDMYHIFRCWCPNVVEAQHKLLSEDIEIHDQLVTIPPGKKALSTVSRDHGLLTWKVWLCLHFMVSTLYRRRLLRSFLLVETKLINVLCDMEYHGIGFDTAFAKKYETEIKCKLEYLCSMAATLCGKQFNIASPKECSHVLFNVLKLPPPQKAILLANKRKNKQRNNAKPTQLSTTKEVLLQMLDLHPLPSIIIEFRTLSKFMANFVEPLPSMTSFDKHSCIRRIHSSILQTSTSTGRLAMIWPNLQCVNKSIKFEAVHRYSIWEEQQLSQQNNHRLSDFVTRLNVNENTKELQCIVANCVNPDDKTNAIIAENETELFNTHIYGTLLSVHCDKTIKDPFPGGSSLIKYWQEKGFEFKDENVTQAVVRVNGTNAQGTMYTYPADKVWRMYAFERITKQVNKDKLIYDPAVNTKANLYPFKTIDFCPRQSFIAPPGYVLLAVDYSQIELRILAHFANDTQLISAVRKGFDVMKDVASAITGKAYDDVTDDERQKAKTVVYGMLYGQTPKSLAHELKISFTEAMQFYRKFRDKYPQSALCLDNIVKECKKKKYITTLLGRRRYLEHINDDKQSKRAQAERQAVNSVCQGSAADLIKVAMIKIADCIETLEKDRKKKEKHSHHLAYCKPKYYTKLILQIHDELLFEVRQDVIQYIAQIVKLTMENCIDLRVPLNVKMKVGKNWGNMTKYNVKK